MPKKSAPTADELTPLDAANTAVVASNPLDQSAVGGDNSVDEASPEKTLFMAFGAFLVFAVVSMLLSNIVVIFLLIVSTIYLRQSIPSKESFDAQKEIKRIKRGKHLPKDHPDKPKTWIERKVRNIHTAVTAGLASAVDGYDVQFLSFGIGTLAVVHDLTTGEEFCWAGVMGEWRFDLGQKIGHAVRKSNSLLQEARSHYARR